MLIHLLARFDPFRSLDYAALATVARHSRVLTLPPGRLLMRPGTVVSGHYYLVKGRLVLDAGRGPARVIDTSHARTPVQSAGSIAARVRTLSTVSVLWVDLDRIGFLLDTASPAAYEVDELEELSGGDWLRVLPGTLIGRCLSLGDLTRLLRHGRAIEVAEGQRIVAAGASGDGFYLMERGTALVLAGGRTIARVTEGCFFGEESLLRRRARNADVVVENAGTVLAFDAALFETMVRPGILAAHQAGGAADLGAEVIDLDRPPWRTGDLRALGARLPPRAAGYRLCGGSEDQRCHAAYLLAGLGIAVRLPAADPPHPLR
jgi:CRP-like cAMP-binding protein